MADTDDFRINLHVHLYTWEYLVTGERWGVKFCKYGLSL